MISPARSIADVDNAPMIPIHKSLVPDESPLIVRASSLSINPTNPQGGLNGVSPWW
jgi:hypothetical protein